jgi:hypothetical protein
VVALQGIELDSAPILEEEHGVLAYPDQSESSMKGRFLFACPSYNFKFLYLRH